MFQALTVPGAGVTAVNVMGHNLCSQLQPCGRLGRQSPNHRDTKTKIVHYIGGGGGRGSEKPGRELKCASFCVG